MATSYLQALSATSKARRYPILDLEVGVKRIEAR